MNQSEKVPVWTKAKNASQRLHDQGLRERCVELAIRAGSYAVAQLVAKSSNKKETTVTQEAKRIFNFIKTGK